MRLERRPPLLSLSLSFSPSLLRSSLPLTASVHPILKKIRSDLMLILSRDELRQKTERARERERERRSVLTVEMLLLPRHCRCLPWLFHLVRKTQRSLKPWENGEIGANEVAHFQPPGQFHLFVRVFVCSLTNLVQHLSLLFCQGFGDRWKDGCQTGEDGWHRRRGGGTGADVNSINWMDDGESVGAVADR